MKYQTISMKQFFPAKGAIYYVAIATVIFSHVKITCYFHMWRYHVFARKLTWYFIGVYIIRSFINSIDWFTQFTTINRLKSWRFRALALRQNESSQCSCPVFLSSTYKWIFRRPSKPLKHFDTLFKVKNVAKPAIRPRKVSAKGSTERRLYCRLAVLCVLMRPRKNQNFSTYSNISLCSKRFRSVSEQRTRSESQRPRKKWRE